MVSHMWNLKKVKPIKKDRVKQQLPGDGEQGEVDKSDGV